MPKHTESSTERDGFLSYSKEYHAAIAGFAPGMMLGVSWNGENKAVASTLVFTTMATALGIKKISKLTNKKLADQLQKEAQYVLGGIVAGFLFGIALQIIVLQ